MTKTEVLALLVRADIPDGPLRQATILGRREPQISTVNPTRR